MTSQIVVFKPSEEQQIKSNKTERQILYEQFERNASIPVHHFQTFMEMEEFDEENREISTNVPSILIKNVLKYCTPIIYDIQDFTVRRKSVDIFKKTKKVSIF